MPSLSVIIPVYNAEAYLPKCLESICSQTLTDMEVLCINDCSSDNSLNILEKFARKDDRIKVFSQVKNSGPGAARNFGIQKAVGEFIGFIDADDWVDSDYFESMYDAIVSKGGGGYSL